MTATATPMPGSLLDSLLSDDVFRPAEPRTLEETGLSPVTIEILVLKSLLVIGSASGRELAERICLPFGLLENLFNGLRTRQLIMHAGSAQLGDYRYRLTEAGTDRAKSAMDSCSYVGAAPVPLEDYILSVEAQTVRAESPKRQDLLAAFEGLSVEPGMLDQLGPAINSGAGLFLYGAPGNGKTSLARRITRCFGQNIWIPRVITEDGQIIKLYDAAYHEVVESEKSSILKSAEHDHRWIRIRRPTVVVGGELTLDGLEIRHDPYTNVSEAPLQMKSNCGCLLIDDFGRQRIEPQQLLNRWIVPLENRIDFLTISTGKKIQVPFEQLIIFSTNLQPQDLTDDAFLRRIPYKIEVGDPTPEEFRALFQFVARGMKCEFRPEAVDDLITRHYRPNNRPLRRCQPRDLMLQIRNYTTYHGLDMEMKPELFDRAVQVYFTVVAGN